MEKYVLVEFPQDTTHFEENEIGYPCCEAEDNGARYVSIEDYEKYFGTPPDPAQCHVVVQWPESQELLDDPKYEEYTESVMDEKGLADFICPAYWVPLCYYQKNSNAVQNDYSIGYVMPRFCEKAGHEVLMQYEGKSSWICLHNDTKEEDLKVVEEYKKLLL